MEPQKKFYVALAIYAVLGVAIWLTIDNIPLPVGALFPLGGKNGWFHELLATQITLRQLALMILGLFVVRTVLHWYAERIRNEREEEQVLS
jgi:hypothetical protein